METSFIILTMAFICCLFGSFAFLFLYNQKANKETSSNRLPVYLFLMAAVVGCALSYFFQQPNDFVSPFTLKSVLFPLLGAFLMGIGVFLPKRNWIQNIIIVLSVWTTLFLFPEYRLMFDNRLPAAINFALSGILWLLATYSLRVFIKTPAILYVSLSAFFIGGIILSIIGGTPLLLGLFCLCFAAPSLIFLSATGTEQTSDLSAPNTDIIGYLCGWLILIMSSENCGPCAFVLWSFVIAEFLWAWIKKLTFLPPFATVSQNTVSYQAVLSGLSIRDLTAFLIKTDILLIIFSSIEIFAPDAHSLPSICAIIVIWNLYRLDNWQIQGKTLKETNQEFFKEIKKNAALLKDNFTRKE